MAWAPDYATTTELKSTMDIDVSTHDTELGLALTGSSRAVDRSTNRQFGVVAAAEERAYTPWWDRRRQLYVIEVDDLMTTTDLAIEDEQGNSLAALVTLGDGGYRLEPRNNPQKGRPWTQLVTTTPAVGDWLATGIWGWSAVPDTIKAATLLQAERFYLRRQAPFGVAGSPDEGSEMRLLAKVDPDVAVMVGAYRRWWAAA